MGASEHLKKIVLYAKEHHCLKPKYMTMEDEEIVYLLDRLTEQTENVGSKATKTEEKTDMISTEKKRG